MIHSRQLIQIKKNRRATCKWIAFLINFNEISLQIKLIKNIRSFMKNWQASLNNNKHKNVRSANFFVSIRQILFFSLKFAIVNDLFIQLLKWHDIKLQRKLKYLCNYLIIQVIQMLMSRVLIKKNRPFIIDDNSFPGLCNIEYSSNFLT